MSNAIKAKRHPKLEAHKAALQGRQPEVSPEILGCVYSLRYLLPEGDSWVAQKTSGNTYAAVLLNSRIPTLAASLTSVDYGEGDGPLPVEVLFQLPDDMDTALKEHYLQNSEILREWRRETVLDYLREEVDSYVIEKLYDAYTEMAKAHKELLKSTENLSKRIPLPV